MTRRKANTTTGVCGAVQLLSLSMHRLLLSGHVGKSPVLSGLMSPLCRSFLSNSSQAESPSTERIPNQIPFYSCLPALLTQNHAALQHTNICPHPPPASLSPSLPPLHPPPRQSTRSVPFFKPSTALSLVSIRTAEPWRNRSCAAVCDVQG